MKFLTTEATYQNSTKIHVFTIGFPTVKSWELKNFDDFFSTNIFRIYKFLFLLKIFAKVPLYKIVALYAQATSNSQTYYLLANYS